MRGEIFRYRNNPHAKGHQQRGPRYAVVVLATRYRPLSRWLVVPTSTRAQPALFRPEIEVLGTPTLALCDALVAVDPEVRLADCVGVVPYEQLQQIDSALAVLLDLDGL